MTTKEEIDFLRQSNRIEREYSEQAFMDAKDSWEYALHKKRISLTQILEIHWRLMQNLNREIAGKIRDVDVYVGNRKCLEPHHITQAMTGILSLEDTSDKKSLLDPCCGSGRFLIDAFKKNSNLILYGVDLDSRCVKMTVINMWLFDCNAIITQGDSITNKFYEEFTVGKGGFMFHRKLNTN